MVDEVHFKKVSCNIPVVIMDFSGVYHFESFATDKRFSWIDCRHLSGTRGYCDTTTSASLQRLISNFQVEGIHFIDSGNYHYLTKFWTDKIQYPFSLIVFDHHTDMQPPLFDGILSCGSWVKDVLDHNKWCKKVVIVGADDQLIQSVPCLYYDRVRFYSQMELEHSEGWQRFSSEHIEGPVYLSIDKDVLNPSAAITDWDQGPFSLQELEQLLAIVLRNEEVIGVDICGECSAFLSMVDEQHDAAIDGHANAELLRLIQSYS